MSYRKGDSDSILTPNHAGAIARSPTKRWEGAVQAGYPEVVSSEIAKTGVPTVSRYPARQHGSARQRECAADPTESKTPCMYQRLHVREPRDLVVDRTGNRTARREKAMSDKSLMHGHEESNSGILPTKQPNESQGGPQEVVEGRPLTKENHGRA